MVLATAVLRCEPAAVPVEGLAEPLRQTVCRKPTEGRSGLRAVEGLLGNLVLGLGQDPGLALEVCSKLLHGMTLGDLGDSDCFLPPGSGGVDYPLLSNYRHRTSKAFPVGIELDPGVDPGEIPGIHAFLDKFDL